MSAEDIARDGSGFGGLRDVGHAGGEDSVAIVNAAIFGEKADEALYRCLDYASLRCHIYINIDLRSALTEKEAMVLGIRLYSRGALCRVPCSKQLQIERDGPN